jgi:phosphonate transport system ATP-binding protein
MSAGAVVLLSHLHCGVGTTTGTKVLLDIDSLQIHPGERIAVVGHNGAGKTTLLRCLNGFMQPTRGEVSVLGRSVVALGHAAALRQLRAEVGQLMQGLHLVPRVSALDNVLMGLLGRRSGWRTWVRVYSAQDRADAQAALLDVGMLHKADVRADRLSGGERQKVAIARMLMQRPQLILADEPTASLDPLAASEICSLLARAATGATLITVVHNPSLLPLLADRVLGLKEGRLVFDLPVQEVDDSTLTRLYRQSKPAAPRPWGNVPQPQGLDHHQEAKL